MRMWLAGLALFGWLGMVGMTQADAWEHCAGDQFLGTPQEIILSCSAALQMSEHQSSADQGILYSRRGTAHNELRDFSAAITDYQQAMRLRPNWILEGKLAYAFHEAGRASDAILTIDSALRRLTKESEENSWDIDDQNDLEATLLAFKALFLLGQNESYQAFSTISRSIEIGGEEWARKYQTALAELGYLKGGVDGVFGAKSYDALGDCMVQNCPLLEAMGF